MRRTRATGQIPPVVVRHHPKLPGEYELLVGEECWRFATEAQRTSLLARVCDAPGLAGMLDRLDELASNPHRDVIETAELLQRLCELIPHPRRETGQIPHQALADFSGLSRVGVTHYLSMLSLAPRVQRLLQQGGLTFRHGKLLCGAAVSESPERQLALAQAAAAGRWSVRRLEKELLVRTGSPERVQSPARDSSTPERVRDPNIEQLAKQLSEVLGSPVEIAHEKSGKGRVIVRYFSLEILEGLLESMGLRSEGGEVYE